MKCEQVTSVYYTSGTDRKENKTICGGEIVEVGEVITNLSSKGDATLDVKSKMLYQCNSCKTIKLV